jgi:ribosomal-protein-alanine N-acetyltransferase
MKLPDIIYKNKHADADAIQAHLNRCKDDFIPSLDITVNIRAYAKKIAENTITFEVWQNNNLIGLIAAYLNDENHHLGFITNVSVEKEYAGKGIASQLLTNCINFARKKEYKEIALEVNLNNQQAIKLYEKFLFKEKAINDNLKTMYVNLQDI